MELRRESVNEAQAVSGGKVHKFITGKNLKFKGKSYSEIHFETVGVDNKNQTIRLKIIAPKEIFGNEMSLDFRTIRRGPFLKTNTKVFEDIHEGSDIGELGSGNNSARWTPPGQSKKLKFAQLSGYEQKYFPIADELDISDEGYGEVSVSTTAKYNNKKKAKRTADGQLVFENKTDKSKLESVDEYAQKLDFSYILDDEAVLVGTPEPKYVQKIEKFANDYLSKYANKIK
jgi:hypothetical protein